MSPISYGLAKTARLCVSRYARQMPWRRNSDTVPSPTNRLRVSLIRRSGVLQAPPNAKEHLLWSLGASHFLGTGITSVFYIAARAQDGRVVANPSRSREF